MSQDPFVQGGQKKHHLGWHLLPVRNPGSTTVLFMA